MWRRHIAAHQLLQRFMLDADPFLPDVRRVSHPALRRLHICHRRRNWRCTNRTAADSAAAGLILSTAFGSAQELARSVCMFPQPSIHEISTGENHEISAFDCSNCDADERDDDLVQ